MESYSVWIFVSGVFHSASCFQSLSVMEPLSVLRSFLWLTNIPLYRYIKFHLSVHQLMGIWVVCTLGYYEWCCCEHLSRSLSVNTFSFFLGISLGVELLGYMVILCLTFWGTTRIFSAADAPFHIPSSYVSGLQFLHILPDTCYFLSFNNNCFN